MPIPILQTKLYIPPPRPDLVPRGRLLGKLNAGQYRKLTLISAPAGFGKTTLVSAWIAALKDRNSLDAGAVAWLSLDEGDSDPTRFLAYLVAALQTVAPNVGEAALALLNSPQPPPNEAILTTLLNEIITVPDNLVLVLDDYHVLDSKAVDESLTFLLEHLSPQMHVVITTREDPNLPLARLRVLDQLTELRVTDLRFSSSEAVEFLNQVMGLNLAVEDITALESRTEGWIAGLQLAALVLQGFSMQGDQDATSFIKSFTGGHRYVMDYLVEEVLQQQSEPVQSFLLRTSILTRLCGPLCNALLHTSSTSGQETLDYLERANLLIVPLDSNHQWYRYHHLFADFLRARLMKEQPNQFITLHQQASVWFEQNNFCADAIHHALAAEDFERAANLIDLDRQENSGTYFRNATWLGWVKALPDEFVRSRPRLSLGFAWEHLFLGELEAAELRMRDVEQLLEPATDTDDPSDVPLTNVDVVNVEKSYSLRGLLSIARAFQAQALGDIVSTVKHARRALTFVSERDHHPKGLAGSLLGLAYLSSGDLEPAHKSMSDGMANLRLAGNLLFATSGTFVLANIRVAQGRLRDAFITYEQALQLVSAQGEPIIQGTANLHLGLSELYHEQGNVEAAQKHLLRAEELGERAALPEWPYPLVLAQARMKNSQGDLDGAFALLNEAEHLYQRGPVPDVQPVAALKARVWIKQGRLTEALGWAQSQKVSVDDDLSYLREFEHITLVRLLIAHDRNGQVERSIHKALALLARLLNAAEEGKRMGSVLEILVLQSLSHEAQGNTHLALKPLERALDLAEPEGYVRLFVDEGMPMAELLRAAASQDIQPDYTSTLLAAFGVEEQQHSDQTHSAHTPSSAPGTNSLLEPLSERELEILSLVAAGHKNQEIADQLIISLNTVRYHTKNIYGKLSVNKRTQAVAKAQKLGLI